MANVPTDDTSTTEKSAQPSDPITALLCLTLSKAIYPELYAEFVKISAEHNVSKWSLDDPDFIAALDDFSQRYLEFTKYHEEAAQALDSVVPREMVEKAVSEAQKYPAARRRKFAEDLTQNYIRQVKAAGATAATNEALTDRIGEAIKDSASVEEFSQKAVEAVKAVPEIHEVKPEIIEKIIAEKIPEISEVLKSDEVVNEITKSVFTARVARPDIYAGVETGLRAQNPKVDKLIIDKEAERLTNVATSLLANYLPVENTSPPVGKVFQTFAESGTQKAVAPVADFAMGFLGKEARQEVVEAVTQKAFERVTGNDRALRERYGNTFVDSTLFGRLKQEGERAIPPPKPAGRHNIIENWLTAALTGPAAQHLAGSPDSTINDVLRLEQLGVLTPEFTAIRPAAGPGTAGMIPSAASVSLGGAGPGAPLFVWRTVDLYMAAAYAKAPGTFHINFSDMSGWILQWGTQKAAIEGGKRLAGTAVKTGVKGLAGKTLGSAVGTLIPIPIVGTILGWIGGDLITRFVGGMAGRLRRLLAGAAGGARGFNIDRDLPLFFAIGCVVVIILFIIPTSIFPLNDIVETVRSSAFYVTSPGKGGGSFGTSNIVYNGPLPPASAISKCPVAGGNITQGPQQGNHTGDLANSYDIGINTGTPVYPSHGGYVVAYENNMGVNQIVAGSPGNYVRLVGATSDGQKYFTAYEHLLDVSPEIVAAAKNQMLVTPQMLLGYSDNTGNSSGPHLHYQYNGPAQLMLPAGCAGT